MTWPRDAKTPASTAAVSRVGARRIRGWHEVDWDHASGLLDRWDEPTDADLRLDAVRPLDDNVDALLSVVRTCLRR